MRLRPVPNLLALFIIFSSLTFAQLPVAINSYQFVSFEAVAGSPNLFDYTYSVTLINSGPALQDVTATATSLNPQSFTLVPGKDVVDFSPVPSNVSVLGNNTFTMRVDITQTFDPTFSQLKWTFANNAQPPLANAGPNQTVQVGNTVTLDGTGSTNPSGAGTLTYSWSFSSKPGGSNAVLNNPTSAMPTFVVDVAGTYMVSLTVSNGFGSSSASVTIGTGAVPPVANAGPSQVAKAGNTVTLNGGGSTNPSGIGTLSYSWSFVSKPAGSGTTLVNPTSVTPSFLVDTGGTYVINLTVSNGVGSNSATTTVSTNGVPPTGNAGPDQSTAVGSTVHLNGSGSTDANGNQITYSWSLTTVPSGSQAALTNANTAFPTFVADRVGLFVAQLIVNNGFTNSSPSTVRINTNDVAPVANAGPAQTVNAGDLVQLDGSGSTDVDGNPLTYAWSLITVPAGSKAALNSSSIVNPTFTADVSGTYVAQLIVNDGFLSSAASTVMISTRTVIPTANAGPNQTVNQGVLVQLNGSGTDPQGLPLTYAWSFLNKPANSTATLSNVTIANPTFTADQSGNYILQLIVNNGSLNSLASTVTISSVHVPPVANAGQNQNNINVGSPVVLDGSGSNSPNKYPLTYKWSLLSAPQGSKSTLSNPTSVNPSFVTDQPGTYVAQLIVNDGVVDSQPSTVTVTINQPQAPTANAGQNQTVAHNAVVSLSGSGSDPQNLSLTFQWTLTTPAGSTAVLSSVSSATPTFTADKPGTYVAQLVVNNGFTSSASSQVTITATNTPPVANAGANQSVAIGQTVTLNGTGSTDAEHDPLTYSWTLMTVPAGSSATLTGASTATPVFVPDVLGTYVAQLIVNDGYASSSPATVTINVHDLQPPTANAGPAQTVGHNVTVQLNGSGTDPQSLPITYLWTLTNVPTASGATLSNPSVPNPTFYADKVGTYVAQLVTRNSAGKQSQPSVVTITAGNTPPVANAGTRLNVQTLTPVILNGKGSSDADQDPLTYSWAFVSKPASSAAALAGANSPSPTFTPDVDGTYTVKLVVNDGYVDSAPALVNVNAASSLYIKLTPNPLSVSTSSPSALTVTLPFISEGAGVTVNFLFFDGNVVSLPSSVVVPAGSFSTTVSVTGLSAGTTSVTAIASNFNPVRPGAADINVTATSLTLSLPNGLGVGLSRTVQGSIALSSPASAATNVTLTSADPTKVTVSPTIVTIPAGAQTANFNVTGVALGSTSIQGIAPGYGGSTLTVGVFPLGVIILPQTLTIGLSPVQIPVNLSTPAPPGGVNVTLTSSDPSTVALSLQPVFIPGGQLTPNTQPTVTGVGFGAATISASSPGYSVTNSTSVQVTASLSFSSPVISVNGPITQFATLRLSTGAPAGGLPIFLASDKPSVATVPQTVMFQQGQNTVTVPVTGVSAGTANITASSNVPGISSASIGANVAFFGAISVPSFTSLAMGQFTQFNITLPTPAPVGGVTVTLTSDNPGVVTVTPSTVTIPFNSTTPTVPPVVVGVSVGTANITASSAAFISGTGGAKVTTTLSFSPPSLSIVGTGVVQNISLSIPAPSPAPLTISLMSDTPGVASVPTAITFPANVPVVNIPVTAISAGKATISANAANVTGATAAVSVILP
jgi:hypothetical protein